MDSVVTGVTGAVCQCQLMISLISFSFSSVLVRVDRVAEQFRNLKIRPKIVMVLGSGMHIIPSIRQNSHGKVYKDLLEHQDLWFKKFLICELWKLEMCGRGSISLCAFSSHPVLPGTWNRKVCLEDFFIAFTFSCLEEKDFKYDGTLYTGINWSGALGDKSLCGSLFQLVRKLLSKKLLLLAVFLQNFPQCICQALHQKISVLVTHQLQYLRAANQILILKDFSEDQKMELVFTPGMEQYKKTEFLRSGIDFASLLKKDEEVVEQLSVPGTPNLKSARNRTFSESSVLSQDSSIHSQKDGAMEQPPGENALAAVPEESRHEGKINFKVYRKYFTAGANYFVIFILFLLNILAQVAYVLQDWWLSYWANHQEKLNLTTNGNNETNKPDYLDLNFYLGIYAGLTVATILFGIIRSLLVFQVLVNSGQNLHNKMFQSILKAPVLFFDRNPIGKLIEN
ncbi:hypothetical protein DV515_00003888 [Chloebia gouldiae]|uniref:ABC transmembrane type-1 domain-containing protein n=1 Tax=Chloebia gouldiae TaxID=44316 RepID=A0A3L8SSX1_CHLGU|nr:hypothetical protein DV515_00003888 [Chloebia gouldiae]